MLYLLINISLAAIPSALIITYFYRKDRQNKEPARLILQTFTLGFFAVIPAIVLELGLGSIGAAYHGLLRALIRAFLIAALVEESMKLLVIRLYVFNKPAFDEISDGIIYTITASLGFAFFENILYSFGTPLVLIIRGITAVPLHASASGILGYYLGISKIRKEKKILKGLLIGILIHGLYDFLLFSKTIASLLVIPLIIVSVWILIVLFSKAQEMDARAHSIGQK